MTRRSRLPLPAAAALVLGAPLILGLHAATSVQEDRRAPVPAVLDERPSEAEPAPAAGVTQANGASPELADLSYRREFFDYDAGGRRDPFEPLLDVEDALGGPRFDELVLTGVFRGEEGGGMVVVEDASRKGYFLKPGDAVGKATLVEIGTDAAAFDVRDFGISRRETLTLQRPEEIP